MPENTSARPARYVGARVNRSEDPKYLRGLGSYVDDIRLKGMLHAVFVRSPYAHARILSIDTKEAEAVPGVVCVKTGADLEDRIGKMATIAMAREVTAPKRAVLAVDRARYVGDAVAVVVADSRYTAEDGADVVEVDWEPLPVVTDPEKALEPGAPQIHENVEGNNLAHIEGGAGDVDAAFARAAHVFSKRFRTGRTQGAPIEPRGVLASYDVTNGRTTVWSSTQLPHTMRNQIGRLIKVPLSKLEVIAPDVGGGFGYKAQDYPEDMVVPVLSRLLCRPVKWIADRQEDLSAGTHSKGMISEIAIAVAEDGTFLGSRGHFISDGGAYAGYYSPFIDSMAAARYLPGLYKTPNLAYIADAPVTNKAPVGAVRGVGWTPCQTVRESLVDDIARAMDIDPIELRAKNMVPSEPQVTPLGLKLDGGSYLESLERAAAELDYEALRKRQQELRTEGRYIGVGFSPFVEPGGKSAIVAIGGPVETDAVPTFHDRASVTVDPDGSVVVSTGLADFGQGIDTCLRQVAADELGVRVEDVRISAGNTSHDVYGMGSFSSRSAVIGSGTVKLAAADVRKKLLTLAGSMLEASPEDIELYDGKALLVGAPDRSVSLADVAGYGYFGGPFRPDQEGDQALCSTRSYDGPESYSNGCLGVIAEVDPATGGITLERVVAVEDCGVMLNPTIVEGQVSGAVAYGIGIALLEDAVYDEEGQFLSGSLMDYMLPYSSTVPKIEIVHLETPSPVTPNGVKGMAEAGTLATPAAIVNAVADALSPFDVTIDRVPLTPEYVRSLVVGKA